MIDHGDTKLFNAVKSFKIQAPYANYVQIPHSPFSIALANIS